MQETWVRFLGWEDLLEEGMAIHSSCLENPMDRGVWQATVHRATRSQRQLKRLSMYACMHTYPLGDLPSFIHCLPHPHPSLHIIIQVSSLG